jgi:transcriptional regulator with XRE-family HTH domain
MSEIINLIIGPNEPDNVKFGMILHTFRENIDIPRSRAAERIGVTSEYIRLMEKGERVPALGTAIKMLDIYEIPYEIHNSHISFENVSVKFISRIKEYRHDLPDQSRNEMIGEIVSFLVTADDDKLKKILRSI